MLKKKSSHVKLTIIASLALTACEQQPTSLDWDTVKRCVDKNNMVVDEYMCEDKPRAAGGRAYYRWYYGGRTGYIGNRISGGNYEPTPGVSYKSLSSVSRGGLGGTGRAIAGRGQAGTAHAGA